jgi:hypothetical protein
MKNYATDENEKRENMIRIQNIFYIKRQLSVVKVIFLDDWEKF